MSIVDFMGDSSIFVNNIELQRKEIKNFTTIQEGKDYIRKNINGGVICACCEQVIRITKSTPTKKAISSLCNLVMQFQKNQTPLHITKFYVDIKDRNFPWLVWWELVKRVDNIDETKRTSGIYYPTQKGIDFVFNKIKIHKYVNRLMGNIIGYDEPLIGIHDVLLNKKGEYFFNYSKFLKINNWYNLQYVSI